MLFVVFNQGKIALKNLLWGLFCGDFYKVMHDESQRYARALSLILFGDMLGLPILRSTLSLRLLPYLIPKLQVWRKSSLKEDDVLKYTPEAH